jgi:hypothetical protein
MRSLALAVDYDGTAATNDVLADSARGGWVAMWWPIETFPYDWWPIRAAASLFDRLAAMHVRTTGV